MSAGVSFTSGSWRTWLVALAIYGAYAAVTLVHARLPLPLLAVLGGFVIACHGSLQHETIHGHPSRSMHCNFALGYPPLSLWLPYRLYRETHLRHHGSPLCDPASDPESNYVDPQTWSRAGSLRRLVWSSQRTLVGRLLLGPWLLAGRQLREASHAVRSGRDRALWLEHALAVAIVLVWVCHVASMPLHTYLACFVYPGLALTAMRSFAEHRPAPQRHARSAIVEAHPLWSFVFLHNNLHAAHHRWPAAPWYRLPALVRRHRERLLREGAFAIRGYGALWRRYAWRPIDSAVARIEQEGSR